MKTLKVYWHLIAVLVGMGVVLALIYILRAPLLPFLIGLVVYHVMENAVYWVENRFPHEGRWKGWFKGKRVVAILIVNTLILLVFVGLAFYVYNTVTRTFSVLLLDAGQHWAAAVATLQGLTDSVRQMVPAGMRQQIDEAVLNAGQTITAAIAASFKEQVAQLPAILSTMLGLAVLPFFVFYLLKDREKLSNGFYAGLPEWAREHVRNILLIIENTLERYIRATLTLGAAVGSITLIGLLIIGAPLAPLLAIVAGICEMIPTLGPWISIIVASVVTLALAPDKVIFVIVLFIVVQLLENNLLVPRIQSGFLGLHPIITIILLVVGAALAGVWGLLLFVPVAATVVQIYRYIRQVIREQIKEQESVAVRNQTNAS